jgi:two-component system response regulator YesN
MELTNATIDCGFDLKKVKKSLCTYSQATGVESSLIDSKGNYLYTSRPDDNLCGFCGKIQSIVAGRSTCASVHLYGSYQAERFGGKYVYFCPMGMVHWASPITVKGVICAALIGGPVSMVDPEQFLLEDLIRKNDISDGDLQKINAYAHQVQIIPPQKVDSLAELLYLLASNFSSDNSLMYEDKRLFNEIQAHISETVHQMKLLEYAEKEQSNYPFEKEKELLTKIALGDKPASQKILNEILGYVFFSSGKDIEIMKARILELVVLLSRAAVEGGAESTEIFGLNYQYLSEIHDLNTVEDLTFWLSKIMTRFTDCVFNLADVRHKDIIFKAVDYIKRNYMKRITLEEVARSVYLNPSYFSKIFKNEMKCTFISYINKIRINAAKNLLLDIAIPLTEVSCLVGFEDQSYFTKVFKKAIGATPGKFRESRGQQRF